MGNRHGEDSAYQMRKARRKREIRRRRRRRALLKKIFCAGLLLVFAVTAAVFLIGKWGTEESPGEKNTVKAVRESLRSDDAGQQNSEEEDFEQTESPDDAGSETDNSTDKDENSLFHYLETEDTVRLGEDIVSSYAIFVDVDEETILAGKNEKDRIVPASMTKVLTLLVAVENLDDLDAEFTITKEMAEYGFLHDCSGAGFEKGETVKIRDLLYGAILPSGADAALGLAVCTAGSQEAFVELMNKKLEELGLSDTAHFTNCIGSYEEDHYCTVYDMAVIMRAAVENEICREVLSAHTYTTSGTEQHPDGILLSNWFLRRIEDKDTDGEVVLGKTGYVVQSGNCAVSYGTGDKGRNCICVTVNAFNKWKCINDHAAMYKKFG